MTSLALKKSTLFYNLTMEVDYQESCHGLDKFPDFNSIYMDGINTVMEA
jgi:hypothetical protein